MTLSPASLTFGNQVQGTPSAVKTVTLTNGLTKALTITSITNSLSDYTWTTTCPLSPSTLAAKGTCTISVTFTPAALGSRTDTLHVNDSATGSPQNLALTGVGVAAVTATPTTLSFANAVIAKKSTAKTVTVTNNQTTALTITSIATDLADFTTTTTCPVSPATLAAGKTCTISVFFTPAAAGLRSATLTVANNSGTNPTVSLSGTGLLAVAVNPASLTYAGQALGTSSAPQSVTLTNNQATAVKITSLTLSATDYTQTNTCPLSPSSLAGGASCTVSVTFTPKATGNRTGTLTFTDNASNSPQTAALSGTGNPASLVSLAVTPASASVVAGQTQAFTATGTYTDGTTQDLTASATWSSANPAVATITAGGVATAKSAGTSTVTATSGATSGSATLSVTAPTLVSIAVTPANASVAAGLTQQFTATGTYTNGSTQDLTPTATWTSGDSSIATVSSTGLATSHATGGTTISAAVGSITGSAALTVTPPQVVSLAVVPASTTLAQGTTEPLSAIATYTDGSTLDVTSQVAWSSSNPAVATVSASGIASALAVGTATCTATLNGVSGSVALTVTPPPLVGIVVTPAQPPLAQGMTQQFTATGQFADGSTQDITSTVAWTSDTPSVLRVSNDAGTAGLATATGVGTAQVTATSGAISGSTTVTVAPAVLVSLSVTPAAPAIALGTTQQFTATGTFSNGTTQDLTATATWTTNDAAVASIIAGGLATSTGIGTTTVTASYGTLNGSATLLVTAPSVVSITVTPVSASVAAGTTQAFTATATYTDGTSQDVTQSGHWSSNDGTVATVSNTPGTQGLASGLTPGSVTISLTVGDVSGSASLTVTPAVLVSLTVTPQAAAIPLGATQAFTATGTYSDGTSQDVTPIVTWSTSDVSVAVISNALGSYGLATSSGTGTATITATSGSISNGATLTVNAPAPTLLSITIAPANPSLTLGTSLQLTATGHYSDGTSQDITATVAWSSDTPGVASISAAGVVTGIAVGSATLSASQSSISGSTIATVTPIPLVSIAVTPANSSIAAGNTQQFAATGTYADGSTLDLTAAVTWTSSNSVAATISAGGLATSKAQGNTTITATLGATSGTTTLTVTPPTLVSIALSPSSPSVATGQTLQMAAVGTYSDGSSQVITSSVAWSSSSTAVATISVGGLVTGRTVGTSTITATSGSISGSATLTVSSVTLVGIAVSPGNASTLVGLTKQFTATGTYSDGSVLNLTSTVTWSSSNPLAASINSTGLATGLAQAVSTITATLGSISGSAKLTVRGSSVTVTVSPATLNLSVGGSKQFHATVVGSFSTGVSWQVNNIAGGNATVGQVDANGIYTAPSTIPSPATVSLTAVLTADASRTGTALVTIVPTGPVSVAITPTSSQLGQGGWEQFDASVTGSANTAVNWQVNGIPGGNATVGTVDTTGLYLAPVTPPAGSVTVSAVASADATASRSAPVTITASDPLGSVINPSTFACPASSSSPPVTGTCYKVTVTGCPEVADQDAYVKVSTPTGTPRGTVVMVAGGGAVSLYEQFTYGGTAITNLLGAGFTTAQVTWATPAFQPSPISGWLTGPGGVRRLACRFSTVALWIKNNPSIHSGGSSEPFCGTGNSGGSSLLSYALTHDGLDSTFDMIEASSGPTNARIDNGCVCNQPNVNATVGSCSFNNVNLCYGSQSSVNLIDPAFASALCSTAVAQKPNSTLGPLFLADSVVNPGAKYYYPKTDVHLVFGGLDQYQAVPFGQQYANQITAAGGAASQVCVADAPHDVPSVLDGALQVASDLITYCKKQ